MMSTQQFAPGSESCTASITFHHSSGENYDGAVCMGTYRTDDSEIWLEVGGKRVNIPVADVGAFCKELQRAARLAKSA